MIAYSIIKELNGDIEIESETKEKEHTFLSLSPANIIEDVLKFIF